MKRHAKAKPSISEFHFPEEIISRILTFLPVKPLMKFRCVSKWWNSLICSPGFTKEHLECSRNKKLIMCRGSLIYSAEVDQEDSHVDVDAQALDIPCVDSDDSDYQPRRILGSCRGLVCLGSDSDDCCLLWNPFNKTHHVLPDADASYACREKGCIYQLVHGLGFDELRDDYKVVRVVQFLGISCVDTRAIVFSLKSNTWKRVADFPHFVHSERGVFVNGALHFVVSSKKGGVVEENNVKSDSLIASFDVTDESYQLVPQPDCGNQHFTLGIGELGGYLCMIRHYDLVKLNQVWVMKEYGVGESWTELFRARRSDPMHCLRPITYLENVTQVLVKSRERICCVDWERRSYIHVEIYGTDIEDDDELGLDEFHDVCVCTESLVLLDNSDADDDGNVEDDDGNVDDDDDVGYDDSNELEQRPE